MLIKKLSVLIALLCLVSGLTSCKGTDTSAYQTAKNAVNKFKSAGSYICIISTKQTGGDEASATNSGDTGSSLLPASETTTPSKVEYQKVSGSIKFLELCGNDFSKPDTVEYCDGSKLTITMGNDTQDRKFDGKVPGTPNIISKSYLKKQKEVKNGKNTVITLTFNEGKKGSTSSDIHVGDITSTYYLDSSGMLTEYTIDTVASLSGQTIHLMDDLNYSNINEPIDVKQPV